MKARRILSLLAAAASVAIFNEWVVEQAPVLRPPLGPDADWFTWRNRDIAYWRRGRGRALVFVHSHNAAASTYEWRRNFQALADAGYTCYALDLLGYGYSDRPAQRYTAQVYVDLISEFVSEVVVPQAGPAVLIASSLSGAHVVAAAAHNPESIVGLILAAPAGIRRLASPPAPGSALLYALFALPLLGTFLFNLLASRASIRSYLRGQAFANPNLVTPEMLDAYYATSHQPGAKWAPMCFVSGDLNLTIERAFAQLQMPVLLVWGSDAAVTPLSDAQDFLKVNAGARLEVIPGAGALVQDEASAQFNDRVIHFLGMN